MYSINPSILIRNNLFQYEKFNNGDECDDKYFHNFVYAFVSFYALYLAFKCKASFTHFVAACCCPPFYIAYALGRLGGCK
jgi:hypothetical protein